MLSGVAMPAGRAGFPTLWVVAIRGERCMVARAVMKAWQASLADAPPVHGGRRSEESGDAPPSTYGWQRSVSDHDVPIPANDPGEDDPEISVAKRNDIVPRRPAAAARAASDDSIWSSHLFWKGLVVGAGIVLLAKTVLAVQVPFGVDWYGF